MIKPFWKWMRNERVDESGEAVPERVLVLHGRISDSSWLGDEVTPELFRQELTAGKDDISVWINSPGGDCFAAAQIYNMLMDYPGKVHVKIDGMAASAASVIAMAGTTVSMSPVSMLMIHNPMTVSIGDAGEMKKAIATLDEIKESIINAYELRTGLSRKELSKMMDAESWMNANKAVELGFADDILFEREKEDEPEAMLFSRASVTNCIVEKIREQQKSVPENTVEAAGLQKRLALLM